MSNISFLLELSNKGVQFLCGIPTQGGWHQIFLSPDELIEYHRDTESYIAKYYGVSPRDYLCCKEENFSVRCSALTTKRKRCKHIVTGGSSVEPKQWVKMQGEYCSLHSEGINP